MDVFEKLNKTSAGRQVISFIREKKGLDVKHQTFMMRILYEHAVLDRESPLK